MLFFDEIEKYFDQPPENRSEEKMVREYLQYEMLDSLYKQRGSENLVISGSSALKIVHQIDRYPGEINLMSNELNTVSLSAIAEKVLKELRLKGFKVELTSDADQNSVFFINFSGRIKTEFRLILDQEVDKNAREVKTLWRFGVYRMVLASKPEVILAQLLLKVVNKTAKAGIDFYDIIYTALKAKPDYNYIFMAAGTKREEFISKIKEECRMIDFHQLSKEAESDLYVPAKASYILQFRQKLPNILE